MEFDKIFKDNKTIAVVGMSKNQYKPSYSVPMFMKREGFNVIPVNPTVDEISGMKCYNKIDEIPEIIDILNIFRPSEDAFEIVKEAIARNKKKGDIKVIWLQEGIYHDGAKKLAEEAGITYIEDKCMYKEYF